MPFAIHQAVGPVLFVSGFAAAVTGVCMLLRSAPGALIRWHRTSAAAFIVLGILYAVLHVKGKLKLPGMHMPVPGIAVAGLLLVVLVLAAQRRKDSTARQAERE